MSESFYLEIISPEQILIKSEVKQVVIPAFEGLMTILKDHIPLVTFLRPGFIEVETSGLSEKFYVEEGTVEFSKNQLLILSSTAVNKKNFTFETAGKMLEQAREKLANTELKDKEKYILSYKIDTLREIN
tara:strand:+ start:154 stop:543 length:390 start_codon:yes stop_codon:yes gene_type:complete